MNQAAYQAVKKALLYSMGRCRLIDREQELWKRIESECSPQQKAALTRAVRQRTEELETLDLETIG